MPYRPYQDKNLLSDSELEQKIVVMGPLGRLGPTGHHPGTMVLYFVLEPTDKQRLIAAMQGKSPEKIPIFGTQRIGNLGTIDVFWRALLARECIAGAVQFLPLADTIIITHMAIRSNWRRLGINSRLMDCIKQRFPNRKLIFQDTTKMGQQFVEGYNG
jgi:hypothetical protein